MADHWLDAVNLTGRWVGFYRYRSAELGMFPITAQIRQEGNRISGEMYDQITERSESLLHQLDLMGDDISPGRRARLQRIMEQLGTGEIVVNSRLPDTSDLDGTLAGGLLRFTKSYRGSHTYNWSVGGRIVGAGERPQHKVYYSGRYDEEGRSIAGEWRIRKRGLLGRFLPPSARGAFELYKKS
jgi:hypothetical protein